MKKRLSIIFLCCILVCGIGYAKTIGFACMYNLDAPAEAAELTTALENELFECCFDRGIVATSIEYMTAPYERYKDDASLIKLFDSSVDYVVILYCEYKQAFRDTVARSKPVVEWKLLQWKFIDCSSRDIILEKMIDPGKIPEVEPRRKVKTAGQTIGASIFETL